MKTLSATIATALFLTSVSATAASSNERIVTPVAPTKAAAYKQGVNKLASLQNSSPSQLRRSLSTPFGEIEPGSLRLQKGGFVTVQERADASGKIGYVAIVNIGVNFERHDSDQ